MHIITGEFLFQHAEGTAGDQPEAVAAVAEALDGFLVLVPDETLFKCAVVVGRQVNCLIHRCVLCFCNNDVNLSSQFCC